MLSDFIERQKHIEFLSKMTLSDYPNMEQKQRNKLHKETSRAAYPESFVKRDVDGNIIDG